MPCNCWIFISGHWNNTLRTVKFNKQKTLFSNVGLLFVKCLHIKVVFNWTSESQFPRNLPYQSYLVPFRILLWHFYAKYCNSEGDSTSKKLEVVFIQTCEDVPEKNTYNVLFTFGTHLKFEIFFIIYEFKAFSYIAKKLLYGYPDFTHGVIKCPHLWGHCVVTVGTHQMWSKRIRRISINAKNISSRCYRPSL